MNLLLSLIVKSCLEAIILHVNVFDCSCLFIAWLEQIKRLVKGFGQIMFHEKGKGHDTCTIHGKENKPFLFHRKKGTFFKIMNLPN